jgi:hypothetical protein
MNFAARSRAGNSKLLLILCVVSLVSIGAGIVGHRRAVKQRQDGYYNELVAAAHTTTDALDGIGKRSKIARRNLFHLASGHIEASQALGRKVGFQSRPTFRASEDLAAAIASMSPDDPAIASPRSPIRARLEGLVGAIEGEAPERASALRKDERKQVAR